MAEYQYYMSVAWIERKQKHLAVISEGHSNVGDENVMICALQLFDNQDDATPWFEQQLRDKPWLVRN